MPKIDEYPLQSRLLVRFKYYPLSGIIAPEQPLNTVQVVILVAISKHKKAFLLRNMQNQEKWYLSEEIEVIDII